jgi:hypothetical protein
MVSFMIFFAASAWNILDTNTHAAAACMLSLHIPYVLADAVV